MARRRRSAERAPASQPLTRHRFGYHFGVLILVAVSYANSTSGPFILDDLPTIVENTGIRDPWQRGALFPQDEIATTRRPLVSLSFALNYAVGGLEVESYHIVNIAIHAMNALFLFALIRRTLLLPRLNPGLSESANGLALAAAAIWAVHPLNSEAVNYVTQRTELLMALCYLLTLYATLRDRTWLAVLSCAVGMACKETMATAPLAAFAYHATFVTGSVAATLKSHRRLFVGLASTWLMLVALMWTAPASTTAGFSSDVSTWSYLLNQAAIITRYLQQAIWPMSLVVHYGPPADLTLGDVLPQGLLIVGLLLLTVFALVQRPQAGFLGLWVFVTLAPTSSFVPIATEVGAERRMYLPLMALVMLAALAVQRLRLPARLTAPLAVSIVMALVVGTMLRNREYTTPLRLAETVVERRPSSAAHYFVGEELFLAGRNDEALTHLRTAAAGLSRARHTLAQALLKAGDAREAALELEAYLASHGSLLEAVRARESLGDAYATQGRWDEATSQWRTVLSMNPDVEQRIRVLERLAGLSLQRERFAEAAEYLAAYVSFQPANADAWTNLGVANAQTGRLDDAIAAFRQAVALAPGDTGFRRNLEMALQERDAPERQRR
jgi:protein O-mannosyl-transferase